MEDPPCQNTEAAWLPLAQCSLLRKLVLLVQGKHQKSLDDRLPADIQIRSKLVEFLKHLCREIHVDSLDFLQWRHHLPSSEILTYVLPLKRKGLDLFYGDFLLLPNLFHIAPFRLGSQSTSRRPTASPFLKLNHKV